MERSGAQSRTGSRRREPLSDGSFYANSASPPPLSVKSKRSQKSHSSKASSSVVHHEPLTADGALVAQDALEEYEEEDLRALASMQERDDDDEAQEELDEKRDSRASAASSQASEWSHPKKAVGPWQLGRDIGRGMVGRVRKVRHVRTGQLAAAKIIPKALADKCRAESLMQLERTSKGNRCNERMKLPLGIEREVVIMKLLEHPNVVKLLDVWENRNELYLIMELVPDGELFDYVASYQQLEEDETVYILRQVVAALLNAHRLGIYHRDLKPENILIEIITDPESGVVYPQVKLADFRMAALQPKGKFLSTACGSMHYAAPEVFDKRYDGAKADVWSLGIILYVMLSGVLPFDEPAGPNKNDIWYRMIKTGQYRPQTWLSKEAQDLISKMLVPHPGKRITLEGVWNHPLLLKWSRIWGESDEDRNLPLSPAPSLTSWSIKNERDIDQELFHNLRVLWHSETEDALKKRLLSNERNFEKLFYTALVRHREEQLENYMPEELAISASDHHHAPQSIDPEDLPPLPASAYTRTKSSLSILHDDTSLSKIGTRKSSPSERSYDPYRSSRSAIIRNQENFNVIVHRGTSGNLRDSNLSQSLKPKPLRVDTLKKQQHRVSGGSSSAWLSTQASPSTRPMSRVSHRSISRHSVDQSIYPSSPPCSIVVRPSDSHKRGVDFSHVRRSSTTSALPINSSARMSNVLAQSGISGSSPPPISFEKNKGKAVPQSVTPVKAKNARTGELSPLSAKYLRDVAADVEQVRLRKSKTHSRVIDSEARKCSVELEKFCEQAFNRDSTGSSRGTATNTTQGRSAYESPPSSVSNRGSSQSWQGVSPNDQGSWNRMELSRDTPNSHMARELAETRRMLSEWSNLDSNAHLDPGYREIMAKIEHLVHYHEQISQQDGRRTVSAPESTSRPLPKISEEDKAASEEPRNSIRSQQNTSLVSNYNTQSGTMQHANQQRHSQTVRRNQVDSPPPAAPLTSHNSSSNTVPAPTPRQQHLAAFAENPSQRYYHRFDQASYQPRRVGSSVPASTLSPISEDAAAHAAALHPHGANIKRQGWFGGWRSREELRPGNASIRSANTIRIVNRQDTAETHLRTRDATTPLQITSTQPVNGAQRPGFLSIFRKKKPKKPVPSTSGMAIVDRGKNESQTALSQTSSNSQQTQSSTRKRGFYQQLSATRSRIAAATSNEEDRDLGIQRNWIARILHIKPASQPMCFQIPRGRVRQALVRLLRSWKDAGIDDVVFDREKNLIFARIVNDNYMRIKEVSFVAQLFVVLERGRHANLCIARFIQRKGAASSFRVVVAKIEQIMKKKGFIVDDPVKKREMEGMLVG